MNRNEEVIIQDLESSVEYWLLGDEQDCVENLGENITSAVKEALNYE